MHFSFFCGKRQESCKLFYAQRIWYHKIKNIFFWLQKADRLLIKMFSLWPCYDYARINNMHLTTFIYNTTNNYFWTLCIGAKTSIYRVTHTFDSIKNLYKWWGKWPGGNICMQRKWFTDWRKHVYIYEILLFRLLYIMGDIEANVATFSNFYAALSKPETAITMVPSDQSTPQTHAINNRHLP